MLMRGPGAIWYRDDGMVDQSLASRPVGSPSVFMRWTSLLFMHWPCPPEVVRPHVPEGLELDTFEREINPLEYVWLLSPE